MDTISDKITTEYNALKTNDYSNVFATEEKTPLQKVYQDLSKLLDSSDTFTVVSFVSVCFFILSVLQMPLNRASKRFPNLVMLYVGAIFSIYLFYLLLFSPESNFSLDMKYFKIKPLNLAIFMVLFCMNCSRMASVPNDILIN